MSASRSAKQNQQLSAVVCTLKQAAQMPLCSKPSTELPPLKHLKDTKRHAKSSPPFNYERYKRYKRIALNAQKQRKIFSIIGAGYHSIRRALLQRGWHERLLESQKRPLQCLSHHTLLQLARTGNDYETAAISKLLNPFPSYFVWHPRNMKVDRFDAMRPFKSRLVREFQFDFTLKEGLVNCDRERRWQHAEGKVELSCPRSYRLCEEGETEEFMRDYRLTGCTSLLAFLVDGMRLGGLNERFAADGVITMKCVEFAVLRVKEMLKTARHEDIDSDCDDYDQLQSADWREFFKDFHEVVRCGAKFQSSLAVGELRRSQAQWLDLFEQCRRQWPHLDTDGFMNVWIMKPARRSRGIGVTVMSDNLRIVEVAHRSKGMRYIVQKYLERPLLIHNTKFDIRQYFLMVATPSGDSMQVWMYKSSYLKFSSQPFSLHNYHESVHLTNHFVQKNYTNAADRHPELPACNMWSSHQFQEYLASIGQPEAWQQHIYAGMRRNIVAAVRSAYEECRELERNCFELVGGDFMVTDRFGVQLLEVNATPDMCASTPVTKEICAACLEDTIKVVVDRYHNVHADTGRFELIDEIPLTMVCWQQNSLPAALSVQGTVKRLMRPPEVIVAVPATQKPDSKPTKPQTVDKTIITVQPSKTAAVQRPTITADPRPTLTAEPRPSVTAEPRPSVIAEQQSTVTAMQQQRNTAAKRPIATTKRTKTTAELRPAPTFQPPTQRPTLSVPTSTTVVQRPAPTVPNPSTKVGLQYVHALPPLKQPNGRQKNSDILRRQSSVLNETIAHQLQLYNRSIPHRYYIPLQPLPAWQQSTPSQPVSPNKQTIERHRLLNQTIERQLKSHNLNVQRRQNNLNEFLATRC